MGRSQETYSKKEREKKRLKKRKEKAERKAQRKAEAAENKDGKSFEDMLMYVDEDGLLTSTPPDPKKKRKIKAEDIEIGVSKKSNEDIPTERTGTVKFFNHDKGYGFIIDKITKDSIFVHINNVSGSIEDNDKVSYEVEMGPKGPNAVGVKII